MLLYKYLYNEDAKKFAETVKNRDKNMVDFINQEMASVGGEKAVTGGASFDRNKNPNKYRFTELEVEQLKTQKQERIEKQRKAREKMIANSPVKKKSLGQKKREERDAKRKAYRERLIAMGKKSIGDLDEELTDLQAKEQQAKELCEQLVEIYVAKNKKTESIITAQIKTKIILLQFILEMWEKGFVIENDKSGRNTIEKEMISYIQQNFMEKISLKEFSEQFHLSEKYISRYFKEHFHITLSQYITHLRLEHAKQLLQDTDIPVTEIAMQSGYQNVSYFIRSFKKTYGVSPLKYRKK